MNKQFSSVYLLTAVLAVLLVVVTGEIALFKSRPNAKELLATSFTEDSKIATYNWVENDAAREQIFVKRAKKNIRVGKTFLRYANSHYQKGTRLAPAKSGNHQYIFHRRSELLILYCVLQI